MKMKRQTIIEAVDAHKNGDSSLLDLIVSIVNEAYDAKYRLRAKGYGVTGTGLLRTVDKVPAAED